MQTRVQSRWRSWDLLIDEGVHAAILQCTNWPSASCWCRVGGRQPERMTPAPGPICVGHPPQLQRRPAWHRNSAFGNAAHLDLDSSWGARSGTASSGRSRDAAQPPEHVSAAHNKVLLPGQSHAGVLMTTMHAHQLLQAIIERGLHAGLSRPPRPFWTCCHLQCDTGSRTMTAGARLPQDRLQRPPVLPAVCRPQALLQSSDHWHIDEQCQLTPPGLQLEPLQRMWQGTGDLGHPAVVQLGRTVKVLVIQRTCTVTSDNATGL